MKRIKTLYIILKTEYGDGEENVFTEILNASSSRSTALLMLKRYMEQYDDAIHHHEKGQRWTSIQLQQFGIQVDDEIREDDTFLRCMDGSAKATKRPKDF